MTPLVRPPSSRTLAMGLLALSSFFLATTPVNAEQSQEIGDYVVHYNAMNTDTLSAEIARQYNIGRSKNRGMVSLTILKKQPGVAGKPVTAKVTAKSTDLTGKQQVLSMREVKDADAIYYLSEFTITHKEILNFEVLVSPENSAQTHEIKFKQEFYTR